MSLPTSMLRVLLQQGIDGETILKLSETVDAEQAAADEARREKRHEGNRRRQKAWYDRHVRDHGDNGVSSLGDQANKANAVMQRYDREDVGEQMSPTPPITTHPDKTPSLPSEASVSSSAPERRFAWPTDFREQFWAAYRRKTDRKKAMVVLDRLHAADRTPWELILAGAQTLSASSIETEYLPHASTWLRNERWNDELPSRTGRRPSPRASPRTSTADFWAADATDAHHELNGGRHDNRPFDTDGRARNRPGEQGARRSDEPPAQQAGADPGRLPALRLVGSGRAHG